MSFTYWKDWEIQVLRTDYAEHGPEEVARRLNRKVDAVKKQASRLKLKRQKRMVRESVEAESGWPIPAPPDRPVAELIATFNSWRAPEPKQLVGVV